MAKVVNMAKAIQQKQEEKQAMALLKELKRVKQMCEAGGGDLTPHVLGLAVKDTLEWWAI